MAAENGLKAERDRINGLMEQIKGFNPGTPEFKKLESEVAKAQGDFNVNAQLQKKDFMEREALPKDKKLFLYCTGGIRCEKAVPEVMRLGYKNVYQLEGGILKYLEEYPEGHFKGECFVFDRRVSVDSNLKPTNMYSSCPHCGNPGKERIACSNCGCDTVVCHRCVSRADRNACSKNCAHHIRRKAATSVSQSIAG